MKRKNNKAIEFDLFELIDNTKKIKKDKKLRHELIMNHPHPVMRWWFINGRNIRKYEHLYYAEKNALVRSSIIKRTKNIELLGYAMIHDKDGAIRRAATIRFSHLFKK